MDMNQGFKYAGFWNRFFALFIDVIVVSFLVFPFALAIGLWAPNSLLVEVPFDFFTTTERVSETPEVSEKNSDGSTNIVVTAIEKDIVLGIWENYYKVHTQKSNGKTESSRVLIDPETKYEISVTSSSDIELFIIFIYWIVLEASVWQGSVGKKIMGIQVFTESGSRPTIFQAAARNLLKILSGLTIFIGFMMAGWTNKKQALHDIVSRALVMKASDK